MVAEEELQVDEQLTGPQKQELLGLLQKYEDCFSSSMEPMGFTHLVQHSIEVENTDPVRSRPYRISHKEREVISNQIQEMLQNEIIRPSHSPWASPVVLVKKKDNKMRFCVDYRKLNSVTKKSTYPMTNIDDILMYLGGAKYFSTLDLFSGYWQVGIEEESKQFTAFTTPGEGLYEFNVLPFGLCNAPCLFQNLTDSIFSDMKWKEVLV